MAKPGFKPGDQVIMTKVEYDPYGEYRKVNDIFIIAREAPYDARSGYWTTCDSYISIFEECELAQPYLNEQEMKRLLGVDEKI